METSLFDPNTISKYWKNQIPPSNLSAPFTDNYFPPNNNSLLSKDKNGNFLDSRQAEQTRGDIKVEFMEWTRISEMYDHYNVFENKIDPNDLLQGSLGDCYLIAAISSLAKYPELVYQIFRTKEKSPYGYYEVVLFIDGEWQIVFIDDYLPVYKGNKCPLYGRSSKRNDIWSIILEKAWAKINGGYLNIIGGYPSQVLTTMTGFPCQISRKYFSDNDYLEQINSGITDKNIICACTTDDKSMFQKGLVARHAYSLLNYKEATIKGKFIRLIKLRNPWGERIWNGNYSNDSQLWTDEARKIFSFDKPFEDGSFWIPFEDLRIHYDLLENCHFMYNSNILSCKLIGNDLKFPNVFNLYIENDSKVALSLFFKNYLFNRPSVTLRAFGCILLAKYDNDRKITNVTGKDIEWNEDLHFIQELTKGFYIVIAYFAYEAWKDHKPDDQVIFRVSSISSFKLLRLGSDNDFIALKRVLINGITENSGKQIQCSEFVTKQDMYLNLTNCLFSYIYFSNNSDKFMKIDVICNFNDFLTKEPFKINKTNSCIFYLKPKSQYIILLHKLKRNSSSFKTKIQSTKVTTLPHLTESYGIPKNIDYYLNIDFNDNLNSLDFFKFHSLEYDNADFIRQFPIIDLKKIREEERRIKEEIQRQEKEEKAKLRLEKLARLKEQGIIVNEEDDEKEECEEGREYDEYNPDYYEGEYNENEAVKETSLKEIEKSQEITKTKCQNGHLMSFWTEKVPFKCTTCQNEIIGNFWECQLCQIKQCNKCQPAKMVMDDSKCPSNHPWELLLSKQRDYKRFKCYYCSSTGNSAGFNCKICNIDICYKCGPELSNKCCFKNHPLKYVSGTNLEFGSYVCSKCSDKYEYSNVWEDEHCELTICLKCKIPDYKQENCPNLHKIIWKNSNLREGEEYDCDACGFPHEEGWNCEECSYNVCKECGPYVPELIDKCPNNHKLIWASKDKTKRRFNCDKCKNNYENTSEWFCSECQFNVCINCRNLKIKNQSKCINNHNLKFINSNDESNPILCISCDKKFMSSWNCAECNFNVCVNCSIIPEKGCCPNKHNLFFNNDLKGVEIFCDICNSTMISSYSWSCKECNFNVCSICGPEQLGMIFANCPQNHKLKVNYLNHSNGFCSKCMSKSSILWNCSLCEFNVCLKCGPIINNSDKSKCPYGELLKWTSSKDRGNEEFFYCSGCRIVNFSWSWRCVNCSFNYCIDCGPRLNLLKLECTNEHILKYKSSYERINITNNSDYYCYKCSVCKKSFTGGSWNCYQCYFDLCNSCKICYDDLKIGNK